MNTLDAPVYLAGLAVLVILGMLVWGYFIARSIERSEAAHMGDAIDAELAAAFAAGKGWDTGGCGDQMYYIPDETAIEPTRAERLP